MTLHGQDEEFFKTDVRERSEWSRHVIEQYLDHPDLPQRAALLSPPWAFDEVLPVPHSGELDFLFQRSSEGERLLHLSSLSFHLTRIISIASSRNVAQQKRQVSDAEIQQAVLRLNAEYHLIDEKLSPTRHVGEKLFLLDTHLRSLLDANRPSAELQAVIVHLEKRLWERDGNTSGFKRLPTAADLAKHFQSTADDTERQRSMFDFALRIGRQIDAELQQRRQGRWWTRHQEEDFLSAGLNLSWQLTLFSRVADRREGFEKMQMLCLRIGEVLSNSSKLCYESELQRVGAQLDDGVEQRSASPTHPEKRLAERLADSAL